MVSLERCLAVFFTPGDRVLISRSCLSSWRFIIFPELFIQMQMNALILYLRERLVAQLISRMQGAVILTLISFFFLKLGESLLADRFLDDGEFCSPISCFPSHRIQCKCRHENYTRTFVEVQEIVDLFFNNLMKQFVTA